MTLPSRDTPAQRSSLHSLRKWLAYFVLMVSVSMFTSEVAIPFVRLLQNRYELTQYKTQWEHGAPEMYQVTVRQRGLMDVPDTCHNPGEGYILTVTNGEVTASNAPVQCNAIFQQLTIERSFDLIDQALRDANLMLATKPALKYDPTYSYVTFFYISQAETMSSSRPSEWHDKSLNYDDFKILKPQSNSSDAAP